MLRGCIDKFVKAHPKPPRPLATKYTAAPADGLDLLAGMLHFNPAKRLSIEQAMAESCAQTAAPVLHTPTHAATAGRQHSQTMADALPAGPT